LTEGVILCVSEDGDSDRVLYYYHSTLGFRLLGVTTLIAVHLDQLLAASGLTDALKLGIVQTADANGSSTEYIINSLGLLHRPVQLVVPVRWRAGDRKVRGGRNRSESRGLQNNQQEWMLFKKTLMSPSVLGRNIFSKMLILWVLEFGLVHCLAFSQS